jgi:hypothetical protein
MYAHSRIEKVSEKETVFLPEMSKNLRMTCAAVTHPTEGLCLNALLTVKVGNFLICLVGTNDNSVCDTTVIYYALGNICKR